MRSRLASFVLAAGISTTAGCVNTTDLESSDDGAFFPGGSISYELHPGVDARRKGPRLDRARRAAAPKTRPARRSQPARAMQEVGAESVRPPQPDDTSAQRSQRADRDDPPVEPRVLDWTLSVGGDFAFGNGGGKQSIAADEEIDFEDIEIRGPARLDLDYSLYHSRIFVRSGLSAWDIIRLEGIAGLGIDHLDLEVSEGDADSDHGDTSAGFLLGAALTLRPHPAVDLFAEYTVTLLDEVVFRDTRVGAKLNITRNLGVDAGYRWWRYEDTEFFGSQVDLKLRGPTVGLVLLF